MKEDFLQEFSRSHFGFNFIGIKNSEPLYIIIYNERKIATLFLIPMELKRLPMAACARKNPTQKAHASVTFCHDPIPVAAKIKISPYKTISVSETYNHTPETLKSITGQI